MDESSHKFTAYQLESFFVISVGSIYLEINKLISENDPSKSSVCNGYLHHYSSYGCVHDMLSQEYQRAKKSEILALKNEAYQSEIDNMKNQELSIRRMRHDIKIDFLFMRCYLSWKQRNIYEYGMWQLIMYFGDLVGILIIGMYENAVNQIFNIIVIIFLDVILLQITGIIIRYTQKNKFITIKV